MASQTILMITIAFTPMLLAPVSEAVSVLIGEIGLRC
jgi:hypothetical protein